MLKYKTKYNEYDVGGLVKERYVDSGNMKLSLVTDDGEPILIITSNVDGTNSLRDGYSFVKEYSENEGIGDWLEENNIAKRTDAYVDNGFVKFFVWEFNMDKVNELSVPKER